MARDYRRERELYHGKPEQKKRNAARKRARRIMERAGLVKVGDGKDVNHIDGNPLNNKRGNLRVENRSKNRARKPKKR